MTSAWIPAQDQVPEAVDFRNAKTSKKGYAEKNKAKHMEARSEFQATTAAAPPVDMAEAGTETAFSGKAYSRAPVERSDERSSKVMKVITKTSWDKKMKDKQQRQALREQKRAVIQLSKEKRKADAEHRKTAQEKKQANKEKSLVVQKITKTSTVKRMMKDRKQKKLLRKQDTN